MARGDFVEVEGLCAADLRRIGAARVEVAAWRWIGGAGDLSFQLDISRLHARVGHRHGRHQGGRIGVPGLVEQLAGFRHFNQFADIQAKAEQY